MLRSCVVLSLLALLGSGHSFSLLNQQHSAKQPVAPVTPKNAVAAAGLALVLAFGSAEPALASTTAAQISLDTIPPTSIKIDIKDLPVVGNVISGTYTKVADGSIKSPSVTIQSPKDKLSAIKNAASGGHLEFDVNGVVKTHLDVDVSANKAGTLTAKVASPLIPKLVFDNTAGERTDKASKESCIAPTGKATDWYKLSRLRTALRILRPELRILFNAAVFTTRGTSSRL